MSEGAQARGGAVSSLPGGELHPSASRDEHASVADTAADARPAGILAPSAPARRRPSP
ncbi:MAG: hypothetical protein JWM29_286 [Solirubrobacterales bacterium]|jgi:hypothetical protein|nr:hypothetical protein [Solirubrobacterales bacterium]